MSTKDIIAHLKHVDFPTQQRRLRHLRSVAARNLTVAKCLQSQKAIHQLKTFYTLHQDLQSPAFYKSETVIGSLNPTWRSLSVDHIESECLDASSKSVVVRVWQSMTGSDAVVTICWSLHFSGLIFLGDKLQRDDLWHSNNTLIIGLRDGFFGCPHDDELETGRAYSVDSIVTEQMMIKQSYSSHTLDRIKTVLRAIQQTRATVTRVKHSLNSHLAHSVSIQKKKATREESILLVNKMRADLEWRTMKLQSQKENYELKQTSNYQRDVSIENTSEKLQKDLSRLGEKKKMYFDIREGHIKTGAQLVMRRKLLISELACIYPITEHEHGALWVCGVRLPNSEDFSGQDEIMLGVSLGYTCHLVMMISHFLDVPLRYPMQHRGSRSLIHDHIIDKLSDKERDFPIYGKGKEKFQFQYGVYLLNKNIAQLRLYCGLGTSDLRLTLANLKSLLELRLGVKFEQSISPTSSFMPSHSITVASNKITHSTNQVVTGDHQKPSTSSSSSSSSSSSAFQNIDRQQLSVSSSHGNREIHSDSVAVDNKIPSRERPLSQVKKTSYQSSPDENTTRVSSFEILDISSGEDSGGAVLNSKFKQWPRNASVNSPDSIPLSLSDNEICPKPRTSSLSDSQSKSCDALDSTNDSDFSCSTFKTKAMLASKNEDVFNNEAACFTHVHYREEEERRGSSASGDLATFSTPYLMAREIDSDRMSAELLMSDS